MLGASSTGFGDYIYSKGFFPEVSAHPDRRWTTDELIRRSLPPYQSREYDDPGREWDYSHTGLRDARRHLGEGAEENHTISCSGRTSWNRWAP